MPTLDNIKAVVVDDPAVYAMLEAGLNKMLSETYFNVTVVSKSMPSRQRSDFEYLFNTPEYRALCVLHTVNYADMEDDARLAIPGFIKMLTGIYSLTAPEPRPDPAIGEVAVGEPTTGGTIPSVTLV